MNRFRAAILTTLLATALLLAASTATAQMTGDTPSNTVTCDVMASSTTSFSTDATINTGASNRFETPGLERPMNQASVSWRVLPAEERFWLLRLVIASMWRWPGL